MQSQGLVASVKSYNQCSRKRVRQLKRNVKSHVFWILKKKRKNVKNVPLGLHNL